MVPLYSAKCAQLHFCMWAALLYNTLAVAAFAPAGVLARIALNLLFGQSCADIDRPGSALFIDLPSNMVGSLLMGFLASSFAPRVLKEGHLSLGLRTGFCGSLTSFASWILQVVTNLMRRQAPGLNAARLQSAWPDALVALLIGTVLPLAAYRGGHHLAQVAAQTSWRRRRQSQKSIANGAAEDFKGDGLEEEERWARTQRWSLLGLGVLLCIEVGLFIGLAVGDGRESYVRRSYWIACLLGIVGASLRYLISLKLNGRHIWLPLGTLAANLLGCAIDFVTFAVIDGGSLDRHVSAKVWGAAIRWGLAGALSTVSTWAHEIDGLAQGIAEGSFRSYTYASLSVFPAVAMGLAIYGWALR